MKIRTIYNRVERVIYEFEADDIRRALEEKAHVKYQPDKRIEFDWNEEDGRLSATLTVVWESPQEATDDTN